MVLVNRLSGRGKNKLATTAKTIINILAKVRLFRRLKEEHPRLHHFLGVRYHRASKERQRKMIEESIRELLDDRETIDKTGLDIKLGVTLIDLTILSGINIIQVDRTFDKVASKKQTIVNITQDAERVMVEYADKMATLANPVFKPMISPPRDWTEFFKGGLLVYDLPFIKTHKDKNWYKEQDYEKIFPAVNKLQSLEWRINKKIMDVISDIFEADYIDPASPITLPRLYGDLPTATVYTAEELITKKYSLPENSDMSDYIEERKLIRTNLAGETSRRLSLILALSIAQEYCNYDKIYFPYQLDYRGRVYPIVAHLNPQGTAYIKAMLEFSKGEKLDERGEYWLKIHIANTYGKDKEEFNDRIEWFNNNIGMIHSVAVSPLDNIRYWNEADSPFEFLAACMAWLDHTEGKEVHIPIQLDATNSGLQFYSGALGDKEGAQLVNIINKEVDGNVIRADVYQEVANNVQEWLESDECPTSFTYTDSEGTQRIVDATQERKDLITYGVTRKMVKRNVMTIPYSVSMRGMSKQNRDVLEDMELHGRQFWTGEMWVVNRLLTEGINRTAYKLLKGAKLGQAYLKKVASLLKTPATWYTPIFGFPVKQQVFGRKEHRIKTVFGTLAVKIEGVSLDKKRQSSSIAPNFIHSLDATVLLSILTLAEDYDVGVIHDCFLVSPNNGDKVRDHYRDSFISLMMIRPLEHFGRQIDPTGKVEVPYIGTMDLADIALAEYIIS
jgi:DNA-directed RNA polymerase